MFAELDAEEEYEDAIRTKRREERKRQERAQKQQLAQQMGIGGSGDTGGGGVTSTGAHDNRGYCQRLLNNLQRASGLC